MVTGYMMDYDGTLKSAHNTFTKTVQQLRIKKNLKQIKEALEYIEFLEESIKRLNEILVDK